MIRLTGISPRGAWVEMDPNRAASRLPNVAPMWVRGLKFRS